MSGDYVMWLIFYGLPIWLISFPFIYAFLLSLPFGIRKGLDKWILFFLHNVTSIGVLAPMFFIDIDYIGLVGLAVKIALDGLVWQFYLKDRKLNGFLCSLICTVIYALPIVLVEI